VSLKFCVSVYVKIRTCILMQAGSPSIKYIVFIGSQKMVRGVLTLKVSMESSKKRKKKERKSCDCRVSFGAEEDQTDRQS
jgi:hypothetical protein